MKTHRYSLLAFVCTALALPSFAKFDFHDHIGLQLWSVRDQIKNDVPAALDWVKEQGIKEVETAGTGGLSDADFAKALKDRGLTAVSAHIGYEALSSDLAGAVKTAKTLGVKYVVTAWIPHTGAFTTQMAREAAANFNKWGEAFRAEGITYGFHPHGYEFVVNPDEGGKRPFDVLIEETKPELVTFEMDIFWVFHAGVDPAALLKKYPTRWQLVHVKDIRKGAVTGLSSGHAAPIDNVAVGTGQIDWPVVLKTAEEIGVKHFLIEDETPTPIICIPDSLKYLRALKL